LKNKFSWVDAFIYGLSREAAQFKFVPSTFENARAHFKPN